MDRELTVEEIDSGIHYCADWDFMLIRPGTAEWAACTCTPFKRLAHLSSKLSKSKIKCIVLTEKNNTLSEENQKLMEEVSLWKSQIQILWEIGARSVSQEQLANARAGLLVDEEE